ncbi:uncharacterized protein APUU_11119S [Aspergillus puulaauensis]|uniref:Uncharacterized protein n=1 Tax=Aspergillus puulaauensis TaxID=1220207 RepID=A0A7R7XBM2_9EURO|nr:uncharacterized protein APUU_11119S [Aspergillus puulaauensis]BCS18291.1 hypothetical protein APUU_11119S [Aspergillus puulaauensis]
MPDIQITSVKLGRHLRVWILVLGPPGAEDTTYYYVFESEITAHGCKKYVDKATLHSNSHVLIKLLNISRIASVPEAKKAAVLDCADAAVESSSNDHTPLRHWPTSFSRSLEEAGLAYVRLDDLRAVEDRSISPFVRTQLSHMFQTYAA